MEGLRPPPNRGDRALCSLSRQEGCAIELTSPLTEGQCIHSPGN